MDYVDEIMIEVNNCLMGTIVETVIKIPSEIEPRQFAKDIHVATLDLLKQKGYLNKFQTVCDELKEIKEFIEKMSDKPNYIERVFNSSEKDKINQLIQAIDEFCDYPNNPSFFGKPKMIHNDLFDSFFDKEKTIFHNMNDVTTDFPDSILDLLDICYQIHAYQTIPTTDEPVFFETSQPHDLILGDSGYINSNLFDESPNGVGVGWFDLSDTDGRYLGRYYVCSGTIAFSKVPHFLNQDILNDKVIVVRDFVGSVQLKTDVYFRFNSKEVSYCFETNLVVERKGNKL